MSVSMTHQNVVNGAWPVMRKLCSGIRQESTLLRQGRDQIEMIDRDLGIRLGELMKNMLKLSQNFVHAIPSEQNRIVHDALLNGKETT